MKIFKYSALLIFVLFVSSCQCRICSNKEFQTHCWEKLLIEELDNDSPWVQIHAAEYLMDLNLGIDAVKANFLKHDKEYSAKEFLRNGHNRILVRLDENAQIRLQTIHNLAFKLDVPDKLSATETLGKLHYKALGDDLTYLKNLRNNSEADELLRYMSAWIIDDTPEQREKFLCSGLNENTANPRTPTICVWGLYYIKELKNPETFEVLQKTLFNKNLPEEARLLSGELLLKYGKIKFDQVAIVKQEIDQLPKHDLSWLYEQAWCQILLYADDSTAQNELSEYLNSDNPELRIVAAWILLKKFSPDF